jgi:hypothetical protein
MLVSEKHHTIRRFFERCPGSERQYEVYGVELDLFNGSYGNSLENDIHIQCFHKMHQNADYFNRLQQDRNQEKTYCVSFFGSSLRKLLNHHDSGRTIGNYSVSPAGLAFIGIMHRVHRINILEPNSVLRLNPHAGQTREQLNNMNIDSLEFIQLHS